MNEEKQKQARLAASLFGGIEAQIKNVVTAKQAYKKGLVEVDALRDYTPEYIEGKRRELKIAYNQARAAAHAKISEALGELQTVLEEKNSTLDLASPEWTNALKLIEIGGASLDIQTVWQINAAFAHDLPALRVLQNIYKAKEITNNGGIDEMIYEIEPAFKKLQETAAVILTNDGGTIGTLARAIGKIADLEGVPFDIAPDGDAFAEATIIGAGLAVLQ